METISVFDMLKIGVGPSSSHTLGPWRAIQRWLDTLEPGALPDAIEVVLYGSLALTGKGHCTDTAICLALLGKDPETVDIDRIRSFVSELYQDKFLHFRELGKVAFDPARDIVFRRDQALPEHPNGLCCRARYGDQWRESVYFSVGGGFVVAAGDAGPQDGGVTLPYPAQKPSELLAHCESAGLGLVELVRANERCWRSEAQVDAGLDAIWRVMKLCCHRGAHTPGELPGGLHVIRRAPRINENLLGLQHHKDPDAWIDAIRARPFRFPQIMQWVSCFALAVNEENANLGRVVTAPTNGAAGVIPAVLMYHLCFTEDLPPAATLRDFLLVAGEIGSHFKKGATISAALGGCQAEIGVSSAMAAAALATVRGGSVRQALMAAEIAMEHHLGMTCDPVDGLVQIPCIERNAMGAVKAINAAELALASDPDQARVSLDEVIRTMAETARDMNSKYKETSQGGLAVNISVAHPEC